MCSRGSVCVDKNSRTKTGVHLERSSLFTFKGPVICRNLCCMNTLIFDMDKDGSDGLLHR